MANLQGWVRTPVRLSRNPERGSAGWIGGIRREKALNAKRREEGSLGGDR